MTMFLHILFISTTMNRFSLIFSGALIVLSYITQERHMCISIYSSA